MANYSLYMTTGQTGAYWVLRAVYPPLSLGGYERDQFVKTLSQDYDTAVQKAQEYSEKVGMPVTFPENSGVRKIYKRSKAEIEAHRVAQQAQVQATRIMETRRLFELDYPDMQEFLESEDLDHIRIVKSIRSQYVNSGSVTRAQLQALTAVRGRHLEEEQLKGFLLDTPEDIKDGRYEIDGLVKSLKWKDGYRYNDPVLKMLVVDKRGFRVFGTVPAILADRIKVMDHVKFMATVKSKDASFGFFSRPSSAQFIGKVGGSCGS